MHAQMLKMRLEVVVNALPGVRLWIARSRSKGIEKRSLGLRAPYTTRKILQSEWVEWSILGRIFEKWEKAMGLI